MKREDDRMEAESEIAKMARKRRAHIGASSAEGSIELSGIALSGGGIRSATFCAGLLKTLARNGVLSRFDVMSTVSGGGYIGATIGKLYNNAVNRDETSGQSVTPRTAREIEEAIADADARRFAAWLRANGRYLIPNGTKDLLFASANFVRSLIGVHFELAVLSMLIGGLLVGLDLAVWAWADCIFWRGDCIAPGWIGTGTLGVLSLWPTIWILLPIPVWIGCVLAVAYWTAPETEGGRVDVQHWLIALCSVVAMTLIRHFGHLSSSAPDGSTVTLGRLELSVGWVVAMQAFLSATVFGVCLAGIMRYRTPKAPDALRNRLTSGLAFVLRIILLIVLLGIIDGLAWWFANRKDANSGVIGGGIMIAIIVLRVLLPRISDLPQNLAPLSRRRLLALVNLAGIAILALIVAFWVSLLHRTVTGALFGHPLTRMDFGLAVLWLAFMVTAPLVVALVSFRNLDALNRSSLYSFYRARLVRSYLGAANPERFRQKTGECETGAPLAPNLNEPMLRIDNVHPFDDVSIDRYEPHEAGGPIHILNVCINQTRDPRGGLFNQDRKGLLMTVGPNGMSRVGSRGWIKVDPTGAPSLGSWMAISGAAVSPGLGGQTRPGIAALSTIAGLRLGYWWDSQAIGRAEGSGRLARWHGARTGKYGQLVSELVGRFSGDDRRYWYLSDGGHFDNTGAYALLREQCSLVVVADCGSDPRYGFRDLENLVRKARIDLHAEVTFLRPKADGEQKLCGFGSLDELASDDSTACLALARIVYANSMKTGYMIVVKPNIYADMPVDLMSFKADNPQFPQEPTTDQFFSEAQWESYFRLGQALGQHLTSDVLDQLEPFAEAHFVTEHAVDPVTGAKDPPAQNRRLPAPIAAAGAVTASFSIGAIATFGFSTWQAVKAELQARDSSSHIQPASMKELTDIFGKMPISSSAHSVSDDARIGEMASALWRIGEIECTEQNSQAFRNSHLIETMVSKTKEACSSLKQPHPSCVALVDDAAPDCLQAKPRDLCEPQYWIRSYGDTSRKTINCPNHAIWSTSVSTGPHSTAPPLPADLSASSASSASSAVEAGAASGPQVPAPPAASSAQSASAPGQSASAPPGDKNVANACAGRSIYIQIYGPEMRDRVRSLRDPWRALGASVPPIEDVWDTARRNGRTAPQPYGVPTVIYHDAASKACADLLVPKGAAPAWTVVPLSRRLEGRPGTIEVWFPPLQSSASTPPGKA
ncbi:patatin-like phospholipase family protein [Caballeronia novacaledonica]|uniref:PNPLA domain-containing protein n=1 Tax=Caballeronia novacaledonica TaxID=1544861 RepID=A0AA37IIY1_9BURK|nr:patatin-like phospholipase family protein [Caballeronia novacaledonica]GJH30188.1 hypothetical protein CBA19CS42_36750 [Caballeronia novacaledonica]